MAVHRKRLIRAAVPLMLVLAAVLGLRLLIPGEALRREVISRLETATGRTIAVGDARVTLWPQPGLELHDLQVGPGAGADRTRLALERLDLRLRWGPLLRRRVEVTSVELAGPRLEITLPADSTAAAPASGGAPAAAAPSGGMAVAIERLSVSDGRVTVRRPDGSLLLELVGLHEDLSAALTAAGDLDLAGTTRLDSLRFHLPQGVLGEGLSLSWRKSLRWEAAADRLTILESVLTAGDLPVTVSGTVDSVLVGVPTADLELQGGPVSVGSLLGFVPAGWLPQLAGTTSAGTLTLAAGLQGPLTGAADPTALPDFHLRFEIADGAVHDPARSLAVEKVALVLLADPEGLTVETFRASTAAGSLFGSARITDYLTTPRLHLEATADLDLAEAAAWQPPGPQRLELSGRLAGTCTLDWPPADPAAPISAGRLRLQNVAVRGPDLPLPLRELAGTVRLEGAQLAADAVTFRMGDSDYRFQGTVRNYAALVPDPAAVGAEPPVMLSLPPARLDLTFASDHLDLDELNRKPEGGSPGAPGAAAPREPNPALARLPLLAGTVRVAIAEAVLKQSSLQNVRGTVVLTDGRLDLSEVTCGLYGGTADLAGQVDLSDPAHGRLDLTFDLKGVQAAQLYAQRLGLGAFARLGGFISGEVDAAATLQGALDDTFGLDLPHLTSAGSAEIRQGRLGGHPLQRELAARLGAPALETLQISDWLQTFRIQDGRLFVEGLALKAGPLQVDGVGWQSLTGELELDLNLLLPQSMAAGLRSLVPATVAEALLDGGGPVPVPVRVTGAWNSPVVRVDGGKLTAAATARAKARAAGEVGKVKESLQDEAARRLRGLLGDTPAPADSAAAADTAATPTDTTKDAVKSLLKKLGGGKK